MEQDKVSEFMMTINERMGRFEERQEQTRTDMKELKEQTRAEVKEIKDSVKEIKETVGSLKTNDAIVDALTKLSNFNKQTYSRPLQVGIIVSLVVALLGIATASYKSVQTTDKTAQAMIDLANKLLGGKTP